MSIAENLKKIRLANGVTQTYMARKLSISRQAYCNYEAGRREPDYEMIIKISHLLGTTPNNLLNINNDNPSKNIKKEPTYEIGSLEWLKQGLISRGFDELSDEQVKTILANAEMLAKAFQQYKKE